MTVSTMFKTDGRRKTRSIVIQKRLDAKLKELAKSKKMSVSRITERIIENFFKNDLEN